MVPAAAPRLQRARRRQRASLPQLPRHDAAERRPGGRLSLWRRRGNGDASGRGRRRAGGRLRRRPRGGPDRAGAVGPAASTRRSRPSSPQEPRLALLCGRYEGFDERVVEHLPTTHLDRPLRARGRRAAGDGRLRRGAAQAPGALGDAESAVEESFTEALEGAAGVSALHAPGLPTGAGRSPRCCSPATTRGSATGGWSSRRRGG